MYKYIYIYIYIYIHLFFSTIYLCTPSLLDEPLAPVRELGQHLRLRRSLPRGARLHILLTVATCYMLLNQVGTSRWYIKMVHRDGTSRGMHVYICNMDPSKAPTGAGSPGLASAAPGLPAARRHLGRSKRPTSRPNAATWCSSPTSREGMQASSEHNVYKLYPDVLHQDVQDVSRCPTQIMIYIKMVVNASRCSYTHHDIHLVSVCTYVDASRCTAHRCTFSQIEFTVFVS